MEITTIVGKVELVDLDYFVEQISIKPIFDGVFDYKAVVSFGISFGKFQELSEPETATMLRVTPVPEEYFNIHSLKESVKQHIIDDVKVMESAENPEDILVQFQLEYGDPQYLVKLPGNLVMPANVGDFRIRICGNKYAFCCFYLNRFFCYKFDIDKYLEETRGML